MNKCELCDSPARMYCESDQASLCWHCDSKVHGANFLVARHCRSLLCHVCQCRTPWTASGAEFGPTVSVCCRCVAEGADKIEIGDACAESETEIEEDKPNFDEEVGDSDDGDVDLQVVPCSSTPSPSPPPATSSSSSSEDYSTDGESPISSLKRSRHCSTDLRLQEDLEPWNKRRDIGSTDAVTCPRSRR